LRLEREPLFFFHNFYLAAGILKIILTFNFIYLIIRICNLYLSIEMAAFEELGVAPELIRAVAELGWT
jgi:hypothetical protein